MSGKRSDHDILIQMEANLNNLCKKLNSVDDDNKEEHKEIRKLINEGQNWKTTQVQECNNRFVHRKIFLWICGFIIMGVIGAYGFTQVVNNNLNRHIETYEHTNKKVTQHENRLSIKDKN